MPAKNGNKFVTEVLKEINADPQLLQTTYRKIGNGGPLALLFKHAFLPEGKFLLPEGNPPYRPNTNPIGMTPAIFQQEIPKLYVFCRRDLTPVRRENIFIQLLEAVHPTEAAVLLAIKDQNLPKLYPNITREVLAAAGFLPPLPASTVATPTPAPTGVQEAKKSGGRGRPRRSL